MEIQIIAADVVANGVRSSSRFWIRFRATTMNTILHTLRGPISETFSPDRYTTNTYVSAWTHVHYIDSPFTLLITLWLTTSDADSNRVRAYDYYTVMTDNKRPTMHRVELTITRVSHRGQERFPLIPLTPHTTMGEGRSLPPGRVTETDRCPRVVSPLTEISTSRKRKQSVINYANIS